MVLGVKGCEAPLGDNGKMENTLKMVKKKATVTRLEEAMQKQMIMWGVLVTAELKLDQ
jgi:hypothetical protein